MEAKFGQRGRKIEEKNLMLSNYGYGGKFSKSKIKHFVRSHDQNAENAIFRTRDQGTSSILGEIYNAGNNFKSEEKRKAA